jgi:PHD/YefM family antitoxin component YafN of YafNO toxin-antitoxin module
MKIHYVTDEEGNKIAVVIPIEDWEVIWEQLTDDDESITPEELAELKRREEAVRRGEYVTLEELDKKLGL